MPKYTLPITISICVLGLFIVYLLGVSGYIFLIWKIFIYVHRSMSQKIMSSKSVSRQFGFIPSVFILFQSWKINFLPGLLFISQPHRITFSAFRQDRWTPHFHAHCTFWQLIIMERFIRRLRDIYLYITSLIHICTDLWIYLFTYVPECTN